MKVQSITDGLGPREPKVVHKFKKEVSGQLCVVCGHGYSHTDHDLEYHRTVVLARENSKELGAALLGEIP